jgi:hypothetical protein
MLFVQGGRVAVLLLLALAALLAVPSAGSGQESGDPSLSLPWEGGAVWRYAYGPHSGSMGFADALDFQPPDAAGKQCDVFTSAFWAVAAADGRAIVLPNAVEVDHGNGYRTGYYHLADKQVRTGEEVKAGQRLGRPGCCPDGGTGTSCWSQNPHLHFYTISGGARRPIVGVNIGGWLVDTNGCLVKPTQRACPGSSLISNAGRPEDPASLPVPEMTVALDVSGSMSGAVAGGELLRMAAPYLEAAAKGEKVTLLAFNSHPKVLAAPADKRTLDELAKSVSEERPDGDTDLAAGLAQACREMSAHGPAPQALVLVTDGVHNAPGRLRDPGRCFAERGWPVFIYGVGQPNAALLQRIAGATGGEYRPARAIFDPACEMQRVRGALSGASPGGCSRFLLRPGERLSVLVDVPPEQVQAALSVTWAALGKGDADPILKTTLRMPDGKMIAAEGVLSHEVETSAERYAIRSPAAGKWEAVISGSGLPPGGVLLVFSFGTTPTAFPTGVLPTEPPSPTPEAETGDAETPGGVETPDGSETPAPDDTETPTATPQPTKAPISVTPSATPSPTPVPHASPRP